MSWVVYASDSKTSGAYADLSTAKKRAQEEANRTGGSAIVYPTSKTGKAKGKTHHVRPSKKNPDLAQKAFAAGSEWWHVGQHTAGVANARIVRYGFLKWWNNMSPAETKGHSKSYLEKAFREGWNRAKRGPQRIPNGRMVPARIRVKGKTYAGKVKKVNGRVKIFVTPQVARKINPESTRFRVMAGPHIALHAPTLRGAKKLVAGLVARGLVYGRLVTIYDEQLKRIVWEKEY